MEDKTIDEIVDSSPSLTSHIHHENEAEEACAAKPSFTLSEVAKSVQFCNRTKCLNCINVVKNWQTAQTKCFISLDLRS